MAEMSVAVFESPRAFRDHCEAWENRRAPVQRDCRAPRGRCSHGPGAREDQAGTVSWAEHVEAWEAYAKRYGRDQSAERLAERGGFGYAEIVKHLGREPVNVGASLVTLRGLGLVLLLLAWRIVGDEPLADARERRREA